VDSAVSSLRQPVLVAFVSVLLMVLVPYSSASSGLGWAGVSESEYTMGTSVQYSSDGALMVSGHKNSILITDASNENEIQQFLVDFPVESVEFTSDANFLIVGMESELPNTPATVVFELTSEGLYSRALHTENGKNVDAISVSHNDLYFATATEDGAIAEWHVNTGTGSNLLMNRSYPIIHNDHINCIDHSVDDVHLLSGSQDGSVILWDRSNQTRVTSWDTGMPITDCTFSPDGTKMTWISGGSLYIRNHDTTFSYSGQFDISEYSMQVEFDGNEENLCILVDTVTDVPRHLLFVNASALPIQVERTLYIPHQALSFAIHPTQNRIAVATNSEFVALYADEMMQESEIPSLIDTDQDNVPDQTDLDDDGDGILDLYDNICSSGNNCHLKPDPQYMRNVRIDIGGNDIVIRDTIHLDGRQSAFIRQLVSESIAEPSRVDQAEYDDYMFSMCSEYSPDEVKNRWASHLQLENTTFIPNTAQCKIDAGLYGTRQSDSGTRISITWTITGVSTLSLIAPYNMTLMSGIQLPSSSVAQMVHTFPIRIEISDASGMSYVEEIWNRRDADLLVEVVIPPEVEPSDIESIVEVVVEYWYVIFFAIVCLGSLAFTGIVRRSNRVDFSDLDVDESYDDDWEELVDDAAAWDEDMDIIPTKKRQPKPPAAVKKDLNRKPKPPAAVRADLEKVDEEQVSTRKVRKTVKQESKQASGTDVEFKHLIESDSKVRVNTNEVEDSDMDDALSFITSDSGSKSKKRRPVRRKKNSD
jgi:hypothetical protein